MVTYDATSTSSAAMALILHVGDFTEARPMSSNKGGGRGIDEWRFDGTINALDQSLSLSADSTTRAV